MGEKGRKCERKRDKYRDKKRDRVKEIERERGRKGEQKSGGERKEKRIDASLVEDEIRTLGRVGSILVRSPQLAVALINYN